MLNRGGDGISLQIGNMGAITGLDTANFSLDSGARKFQVKNDGTEAVSLEVTLANMTDGTFVETSFEVGWNAEIVKAVKANATAGLNLKWGY